CGRWVTTSTWFACAKRAKRRPISTAARPPTPASTSSKTKVVPADPADRMTSKASVTRESSPPDAATDSGLGLAASLAASSSSTSSARNILYSQQQSPTRMTIKRPDNLSRPMAGEPGSDVYPVVFSTYRLTEMYTSGSMSRRLPYLAELQPDLFVEVDPVLAEKRGLENGGWATIISPRGVIEARALVTERMEPMTINGEDFHQ